MCFRKRAFLCTDLVIIAAALLVGFSEAAGSFETILLGRFLYGISAGRTFGCRDRKEPSTRESLEALLAEGVSKGK